MNVRAAAERARADDLAFMDKRSASERAKLLSLIRLLIANMSGQLPSVLEQMTWRSWISAA